MILRSMVETKTYFDFELKPQQQKAFNALCRFVDSKVDKVFILKGYAGTGKTTLMSGLIKRLAEDKIPCALLASTGRAAKILSDKTKTIANTVHSHIYVFNELSEDLEKMSELQHNSEVDDKGQVALLFNLNPISSDSEKIYIIDEASMVSDEVDKNTSFAKFGTGDLLGDILSYDIKGKFIFVGDPCQLPPINQTDSPALSASHISAKYNLQTSEFEMTDIIRQATTNGIISVSFNLRQLFHTNPSVKFASLPVKGHPNIHIENSHAGMLNRYIHKIKTDGFNHSTLICQTNKHCSDLNKVIRSSLQNNSERICIGDLLMVTQNNYLSNLVNGDQIIVLKIGSNEYRCGLSFLQVEVQEITSQSKYNLLLVEDILYSTWTNLNTKQHKDLLIDYFKRMREKGINQKSKEFKDNMLKDPYLNALKCVYGYALTCHKAQGGEWNEVFLYLDNKIHGIRKPGIYQWFYTAVTRAKENLHLVNDWFIK
jgi:ATP-dependent exoDNAse (exonuclease V) alpha subunit